MGEFGRGLARRLASRVAVVSCDRVHTRYVSEVRSELLLRGTTRLDVMYLCRSSSRLTFRLASITKPSVTVMAAVVSSSTKVAVSPRGVRRLSHALGIDLDVRLAVFFLLSCLTLFENEHDLIDSILLELFGEDSV